MSRHDHTPACNHELGFCAPCDRVFCKRCDAEWIKPAPINVPSVWTLGGPVVGQPVRGIPFQNTDIGEPSFTITCAHGGDE